MTTPSSWFPSFSDPFQWLVDEQKKVDEEKRRKDAEEPPIAGPSNSPQPVDAIALDELNTKGKEEEKSPSPPPTAVLDESDEILIVEPEKPPPSLMQQIREWTDPMMPIDGRDINPFSARVTEDAKNTRRTITKEIDLIRKEKLPHDLVSRSIASPLILPDPSQKNPSVDNPNDPILCEKRKKTDEELEKFNAAIAAYSLFLFLHEYAAGQQLPIDDEGRGITYQKMVRRALEPKEGEERLSLWQVYKESLGKHLNLFSYIKAFLFYHVFFTITKFIPTLIEALTKSTLNYSRKSLIKSEMLAFLSSRILSYADTYLHIIDGARIEFEASHHRDGSLDDYIQRALERSYAREFEDLVKEDSARAVELFFPASISFCSLGENSSFAILSTLGGAFSSLVNYFTNALVKIILEKSIIPSIFRSTITNAIDIAPAKSYVFTRGIYRVAAQKIQTIREDLDTPRQAKETPPVKIAGIEKLSDVSSILVKVLDTSPDQKDDISKELEIGIAKGGKIALEMLHDNKVMEDLFASLFSSLYESLISEETFQELTENHDMWEDALNLESDELFATLIDQAVQEKFSPQSQSLEEQTKTILSNIKKESKTIFSQLKQLMPIMEQIAALINHPQQALDTSNQLRTISLFAEQITISLNDCISLSVHDEEKTQALFVELKKFLPMIEQIIPLTKPNKKAEELFLKFASMIETVHSSSIHPENIDILPPRLQELSCLLQQIVSLIQETEKKQNIPLEYGFTAIEIFCNLMQKINQQLDLKKIIDKNPEMTPAQKESFDRMLQPIRVCMLELTHFVRQLNADQNTHYLCSKADRSLSKLFAAWDQTKEQLANQETTRLVQTFSPTCQAVQETIRLSKELQIPLNEEVKDLEEGHQELLKLLETIQEESLVISQLRSLIEDETSLPLIARLIYLRQYPDKPLDYFDAKALKQKVLHILIASHLNQPPFTSMIDLMQTYIPPHLRKEWNPFQTFILGQLKEDQQDLKQLLEHAFEEWKDLPRGKGFFASESWKQSARELLQKADPSDRENLRALLSQTETFLSKNSIIPVYWNHFCRQIRLQINSRTEKRAEALFLYQKSTLIHDLLEEQFSHLHVLQQTTHQSLQANFQEIQARLKELSQMTNGLELEKSYSPTQVITGLSIATGAVIGTAAALMAPPAIGAIALTTIGTIASHFYDPNQPRLVSGVKGAAAGAALSMTGPLAPLLAGPAVGYYAGKRVTQTATDYGRGNILNRVKTMRVNFFKLIPKIRKTVAYALLEGFSSTGRVF